MKLICMIFGHDYYLLRVGFGRKIREVSRPGSQIKLTIGPKMYWHWRCDRCGLTHCNQRFKRYL